jgi:hypothetical protein
MADIEMVVVAAVPLADLRHRFVAAGVIGTHAGGVELPSLICPVG